MIATDIVLLISPRVAAVFLASNINSHIVKCLPLPLLDIEQSQSPFSRLQKQLKTPNQTHRGWPG
jgi:hypothetical protein